MVALVLVGISECVANLYIYRQVDSEARYNNDDRPDSRNGKASLANFEERLSGGGENVSQSRGRRNSTDSELQGETLFLYCGFSFLWSIVVTAAAWGLHQR
ncbi:uncharacterized protein LOC122245419, partial [Penaeus japonicus]|uniref:uncharacterized protein LOC122245419 n=1 Tax=Penaeus japonicus TaxID=27405 RepID=UPI001C711539